MMAAVHVKHPAELETTAAGSGKGTTSLEDLDLATFYGRIGTIVGDTTLTRRRVVWSGASSPRYRR